ncbi:MAG: hypothetical protein MJZ05_13420 [Fibrobacter sp.]|nr:hypothetical protein [Fibrobacter sp.]
MAHKLISTLFLAAWGFANAAMGEVFQLDLTPGTNQSEAGIFMRNFRPGPDRPLLGIGGRDWHLAANLYAGGGAVVSEAVRDTTNPRGYLGAYLTGHKQNFDFALNLAFDNFENRNMKDFKALQYTGHIGYKMDWIQFKAGYDREHFGPGVYNNLVFNRSSFPYDMMSINLDLGPLHVYSFYGALRVAPWGWQAPMGIPEPVREQLVSTMSKDRDVYGHRYEYRGKNLTLGISEATFIYDNNQPWLFVPTVPLFMEKGNYTENSNNGEIAFDAEYKFLGIGRLYTEFLLDDMESPIRLIANDNAESKWAWMAGVQLDKDFDIFGQRLWAGTIAEYARIEPFVYTHFHANTAQAAHAARPVGNPNGPNSQAIDWSIYGQYGKRFRLVLHNKWLWKGTDYGSELNDETKNALHTKKSFLKGAKIQYTFAPYFNYLVDHVSYQLGFKFFGEKECYGNIVVWW